MVKITPLPRYHFIKNKDMLYMLLIMNTVAVKEVSPMSILDQGQLFQLFEGRIALDIHWIMIFSIAIKTLKL